MVTSISEKSRPTSSQCLVDRLDHFFVIQNLVSDLHPRFPAIINAVADESFAELALVVLSLNHPATPDVKVFASSGALYYPNAPD